jgi:predicted nucleic acid-binding protein
MPNELFLVDTSVWIFALRKDPVPPIRNRIENVSELSGLLGNTQTYIG